MMIDDYLSDGLFDYIQDNCEPLTGDCLSVALAFDRILPKGDIYSSLDKHGEPMHFFYGVEYNQRNEGLSKKYIDGNGIQSIDQIKSNSICNSVYKFDKNEDIEYVYAHMVDDELIEDICNYNI